MNSEKRTIRPFRTDARLDGLFSDTVLCFGREQCLAGASVSIRDDLERCAVTLHLAAQDCFADFVQRLREGVIGTGLRLADTCLVVAARSGYLKSSEVVYCHSLDDPSALTRVPRLDEAGTGGRREVFRAATHGVTVDCYLALARTLPADQRAPLVPWRIGTWLSHARFRVRCWEDAELFRPQPLDQEKRTELGLPEGTVTFAEFDGDVADAEADSADVCTFWVDEELLQTIDAQARSATAEVLQRWLFAEFVSAVLHRYSAATAGASAPQERIRQVHRCGSNVLEDLATDTRDGIGWTGSGARIDVTPLEHARVQVEALAIPNRGLDGTATTSDQDMVEGEAAAFVYSAVVGTGIEPPALDDPGFWRYVALAHVWNFAAWREPRAFAPVTVDSGTIAASRKLGVYIDGRKSDECVPLRMFLRVRCLGGAPHAHLASAVRQGTDFWRSHILRVVAGEHPPIVRALIRKARGGRRCWLEQLRPCQLGAYAKMPLR